MPCEHLAGCIECVGLSVTKTFTRDVKTHRCMFCSQKVTKFLHIESSSRISPRELQAQYPDEMVIENIQREEDYERWIREIMNSRDNEDALGVYDDYGDDEDEDNDEGDPNDKPYLVDVSQIFNLVRRVVVQDGNGRNRIVRETHHNLEELANRLRQTASRSGSNNDRGFMLEVNAEAIEGELDYVPSEQEQTFHPSERNRRTR